MHWEIVCALGNRLRLGNTIPCKIEFVSFRPVSLKEILHLLKFYTIGSGCCGDLMLNNNWFRFADLRRTMMVGIKLS